MPTSLRTLLRDWNWMANRIFRTDYSKMKWWEACIDWIVNKITGLTIAGALVPYPIENIKDLAQVGWV